MIDDLTLSMHEARKAGMFDGWTKEQIKERAGRRRQMLMREKVDVGCRRVRPPVDSPVKVLTKAEKIGREAICRDCDSLKGQRCIDIRKAQGCGACATPWESTYVTCPKDMW
jgi:hypothetical protein